MTPRAKVIRRTQRAISYLVRVRPFCPLSDTPTGHQTQSELISILEEIERILVLLEGILVFALAKLVVTLVL